MTIHPRAVKAGCILAAGLVLGAMRQWHQVPLVFFVGCAVLAILRSTYLRAAARYPEPGDMEHVRPYHGEPSPAQLQQFLERAHRIAIEDGDPEDGASIRRRARASERQG